MLAKPRVIPLPPLTPVLNFLFWPCPLSSDLKFLLISLIKYWYPWILKKLHFSNNTVLKTSYAHECFPLLYKSGVAAKLLEGSEASFPYIEVEI